MRAVGKELITPKRIRIARYVTLEAMINLSVYSDLLGRW